MRYILFRKHLADIKELDQGTPTLIDASYELRTFRPNCLELRPKGVNRGLASLLWGVLYLAIWKWQSKDYEYYLVYDGEHLVHYSIVLPKYYRLPFMENNDIHIGPYWTAEQYRGRGICPFVIRYIMMRYQSSKEYAYIMTEEDNKASQSSIIKAELNACGFVVRSKGFLGKFMIQTDVEV